MLTHCGNITIEIEGLEHVSHCVDNIMDFISFACDSFELGKTSLKKLSLNFDKRESDVSGAFIYGGEFTSVIMLHTWNGLSDILRILAHELTHGAQWYHNRLKWSYREHSINKGTLEQVFMWNGEEVNINLPYEERPWEIEAFKNQIGLCIEYTMHMTCR